MVAVPQSSRRGAHRAGTSRRIYRGQPCATFREPGKLLNHRKILHPYYLQTLLLWITQNQSTMHDHRHLTQHYQA